MLVTKSRHLLGQHPAIWHRRCRIRRMSEGSFVEVPVSAIRPPVVRMLCDPRVLERCHESDSLDYTAGPFLLWQLFQRPTGNGFLGGVITLLPNALQFQ